MTTRRIYWRNISSNIVHSTLYDSWECGAYDKPKWKGATVADAIRQSCTGIDEQGCDNCRTYPPPSEKLKIVRVVSTSSKAKNNISNFDVEKLRGNLRECAERYFRSP